MILMYKHKFRVEGNRCRYMGSERGRYFFRTWTNGDTLEVRNNKPLDIKVGCYSKHPGVYL